MASFLGKQVTFEGWQLVVFAVWLLCIGAGVAADVIAKRNDSRWTFGQYIAMALSGGPLLGAGVAAAAALVATVADAAF